MGEARTYVENKTIKDVVNNEKWVSEIRLSKITVTANNMYDYIQDYFLLPESADIEDCRTTEVLWTREQTKGDLKCPGGHALTPLKNEVERHCDVCGQNNNEGALMYSCRQNLTHALPASARKVMLQRKVRKQFRGAPSAFQTYCVVPFGTLLADELNYFPTTSLSCVCK